MSIVTDRIYEDASGVAPCASCPAAVAKSYLVEALGSTLDSIDVGVIIVNGEARILHANQAAKRHRANAPQPHLHQDRGVAAG